MASPTKRRVLAPLDANATMPAPSPSVLLSPAQVKAMSADSSHRNASSRPSTATAAVPASRTLFPLSPPSSSSPFSSFSARAAATTPCASKKRPRDEDGGVGSGGQDGPAADTAAPWKKTSTGTSTGTGYADHTYGAHPSFSPAPSSSAFDVSSGSLVDPSQTTNITEPDMAGPPPVHNASRILLTREQSRQKAEIIKLRLGLARYKLRTGQVDVPLEQLRVVPPSVARRSAAADNSPFSRVPLSLPSFASSGPAAEERRGSGEELASEWVRAQQLQRQAQQPVLPQQPLRRHSYNHSRSSSMCSSKSSTSCDSRGSGRVGDAVLEEAADEDVEDGAQRQEEGEDEEDEEAEPAQEAEELPYNKGLQLVTPRPSRRPQPGDDGLGGDDDHGRSHAAERLTSSVMRGNAVSGLLSLARS